MCSPAFRPIDEIIVAEFEATARPSMRTFQTLSAGKTEQSGMPGSVGAPPEPPPGGGGVDGRVGWLDLVESGSSRR